ncbi:hypothetical protein ABZX85_47595 [Streptomyces sp. NPDC004539]|uniref:hypothetical protein n=1 Tax=Streptomyces sp. NPDC004539 TaxID=3154280 RepID=UPI0033BB2F1E
MSGTTPARDRPPDRPATENTTVMRCTTPGCEGTDFVASTTAYLSIGLGPTTEGEPTAEIKGLSCEEIELACRTCGQPITDDCDSSYDTAVRDLLTELLRDLGIPLNQAATRPRPETSERYAGRTMPGSPVGSCADCGKSLIRDRTGDRVHDEWGEYLCPVTHRVHRTGHDGT